MNENQLFEQMKMWRGWTIEGIKNIHEEIIDEIPAGFNNHIRWNAGHILVGWDHTMFPAVGIERQLPLAYHLMFPGGSRPSEWTENPPAIEEIIKKLEEQPKQIKKACKGHLDDKLEEPFLQMETLGEMVVFHMNHENLHVGTINGMKKILLNR